MFGWFLVLTCDTSRSLLCTLVAHTTLWLILPSHPVMIHFFSVTYSCISRSSHHSLSSHPPLFLSSKVSMSLPLLSVQ